MDLQEQVIYGQQAADILENPVWKDVWSQYEQQLISALKASPVSDVDALQKGMQALQIMGRVRQMIEQALTTGNLAAIEIREKTKLQQAREWLGTRFGT